MWKKDEVEKLIQMLDNGEKFNKISHVIGKSTNAVYKKAICIGYKKGKGKWSQKEIYDAIFLLKSGSNFKQIGEIVMKSQSAVTKKLNRLGYKYWNENNIIKFKSKYEKLDWIDIKNSYESGTSQKELIKNLKITYQALKWGSDNGKIKFRTNSEAMKMAIRNGKLPQCVSNEVGIKRYRQLCEFKFCLKDFPDYFDFDLIEKYGWYSARNRGDNLKGISRDHMYSISDGFRNNISPEIMGHPANCKLMRQNENGKKRTNSSITFEELCKKIEEFNLKYNCHALTSNYRNKDDMSNNNVKNNPQKIKKIHYCLQCGGEFSGKGKMCVKCSKLKQRKIERPSYEQLIKEISETSYSAVGRKYGVSDNAIRKWKKSYEKDMK